VKLDKRVADLEAKGVGTVAIKSHIIGPDDMVIFLIGMSAADGDDPIDSTQG
jgi:hypothetical protein